MEHSLLYGQLVYRAGSIRGGQLGESKSRCAYVNVGICDMSVTVDAKGKNEIA